MLKEEITQLPERNINRHISLQTSNLLSLLPLKAKSLRTTRENTKTARRSPTHSRKRHTLSASPMGVLFMSTLESQDIDIYVLLRKINNKGNALINLKIPWSSIASQGASSARIGEIPKRQLDVPCQLPWCPASLSSEN
jgi:hypothetical protein